MQAPDSPRPCPKGYKAGITEHGACLGISGAGDGGRVHFHTLAMGPVPCSHQPVSAKLRRRRAVSDLFPCHKPQPEDGALCLAFVPLCTPTLVLAVVIRTARPRSPRTARSGGGPHLLRAARSPGGNRHEDGPTVGCGAITPLYLTRFFEST